MPKINLFI